MNLFQNPHQPGKPEKQAGHVSDKEKYDCLNNQKGNDSFGDIDEVSIGNCTGNIEADPHWRRAIANRQIDRHN